LRHAAGQRTLIEEAHALAISAEALRIQEAKRIERESMQRQKQLQAELDDLEQWTSSQFELGERGVIDSPAYVTEKIAQWQASRELSHFTMLQFPDKTRGEIESGRALNKLLDRVGPAAAQNRTTRHASKASQGLPMHPTTASELVAKEMFDRLSLTHNVTGPKVVIRGDGELIDCQWPEVLREEPWEVYRTNVEKCRDKVMAELNAAQGLTPATSDELRSAVGTFNEEFKKARVEWLRAPHRDDSQKNRSFEYGRWWEGQKHLRDLVSATYCVVSARKIYDLPTRPAYEPGNVEEFLYYMQMNNLRFAAAKPVDRVTYRRVFDMIVRYYLDMSAVVKLEEELENKLTYEEYLTHEAREAAMTPWIYHWQYGPGVEIEVLRKLLE
jgi:hypothetical protein